MTVAEAVSARRATPAFDPNVKIPRDELLDLMRQACLSPSSLNLQPWRFRICESEEDKLRLHLVSFKQRKILAASAVIILFGDLEHHLNAPRVADGNVSQGYLTDEDRSAWIEQANLAYGKDPQRCRDEAFRGCSIWATTFMLLAKEAGWDTAPMGGFQADKLSQEFAVDPRYLPVLMLAIGRLSPDVLLKPRPLRIPIDELLIP